MEIKQKNRSEIDEKYKWDLSSIYSSNKDIDKDFDLARSLSKEIIEYKNKDIKTVEDLYNLLELDIKLSRILDKIVLYSNLKVCEDASSSENQELYGRAINFVTQISTDIAFISNKILSIDDDVISKLLNDKLLSEYKFFLEDLLRVKPHMLSDTEEELISSLSKTMILDSNTYDNLTNVDMKFGFIKDEEGNMIELTNSNYSNFLKSKNRNVRKEAFNKFYGTFGKFTTTLSGLYNSHLETANLLSNLRKYDSVLANDLFSDNLPIDVYSNLINTINDNLTVLHRYYVVKKKMIGLEDFHIYDVNAPIIEESSKKYSFEDARNLILDIFKIMGEDYIDILNKAFDERWIDVYNNKGKMSGAFSSGVYDSYPYVLTNFEEKLEDVSALAHELGHSVHTYLSKNNNSYMYYDYSLFVAEIASLTNEIIFNTKMIERENNKEIKLKIINDLLRLFNSNLFDATLGAEFELDVHNKVQNGDVLTSDYFNNLYYELNKKYYGDSVIVDEEIKYRWEIYNHLYSDYYLFKYATGISCACYCASKILDNDKEFIEKYKDFLKIGSSKYPSDALNTIGIDITSSAFIENAIKFYNNLLDEFENIYKEIN